jgi:hypothetical protein
MWAIKSRRIRLLKHWQEKIIKNFIWNFEAKKLPGYPAAYWRVLRWLLTKSYIRKMQSGPIRIRMSLLADGFKHGPGNVYLSSWKFGICFAQNSNNYSQKQLHTVARVLFWSILASYPFIYVVIYWLFNCWKNNHCGYMKIWQNVDRWVLYWLKL